MTDSNQHSSPSEDAVHDRRNHKDESRPTLFWRTAIVFIVVVLIWLVVGEGLGSLSGSAYADRVGHAIRAVVTSVLVVPLIFFGRRYLDRRPWKGLHLISLRVGWRSALFGAAFWLVAAGLGAMVTLTLGWARIDVGAPSVEIILLALYLPVLVFLYEAFPEELIFRGYFYRNLADRYARWVAIVGQAGLFTLFGIAIGASGSVDRIILFFTFSSILGVLRVITDNLWTSIGFHLAFQWVAQFTAAAVRDGFVQIEGQPMLELVAFWLFPIVFGCIVLVAASVRRGHTSWREPDPDPPSPAAPTPGSS